MLEKELNPTLRLLLSTTALLIEEKGCNQLTMNDIINRSGISKGGIYHYVESKDELFSLVLQVELEKTRSRFLQHLQEIDGTDADWIETLLVHLYKFDHDSLGNQILLYLLSKSHHLLVRQAIRGYYRQMVKITHDWIDQGQQQGRFLRGIDNKKMADLFVLISLGLRIRNVAPSETGYFTDQDFSTLIKGILESQT